MKNTNASGKREGRFSVMDITVVGVMAAIVFVITYFIKIDITTPAGPTMLKLANAFCLLAGILFGGVRGGLAAGIGSMMFDVLSPYAADAPFTLIRFFLMAFLCGIICFSKGRKGEKLGWNILGASVGAVFSLAFYFVQSVVKQILLGQPTAVALANCAPKMITSSVNAVLGVVVAVLIAPACHKALKQAGIYQKLSLR